MTDGEGAVAVELGASVGYFVGVGEFVRDSHFGEVDLGVREDGEYSLAVCEAVSLGDGCWVSTTIELALGFVLPAENDGLDFLCVLENATSRQHVEARTITCVGERECSHCWQVCHCGQ